MNNKSPVRQMLDAIEAHTPETLKQWVEENKDRILEDERNMVALAWVKGNDEGWEMNSDWPEHGYLYYDEHYGTE